MILINTELATKVPEDFWSLYAAGGFALLRARWARPQKRRKKQKNSPFAVQRL